MKQLEPEIKVLVLMVLIFGAVVIWCAHWLKSDGQTFQVMSNAFSGFVGALLMWIKGQAGIPEPQKQDKDEETKQ